MVKWASKRLIFWNRRTELCDNHLLRIMYALSAVIPRHVMPLCRKSYVMCGFINIKQVYKGDVLLHTISQKQHNKGFLCPGKKLVLIGHQTRTIHRKEIFRQDFFAQYTKDNVPRDYEIVYQCNLGSKQIQLVYFSIVVAVFYIGFMIYWFMKLNDMWHYDERIAIPGINWKIPTLILKFYGTCAFCILVLMASTFKFATLPVRRVYESVDKQKYIGIFRRLPWTSERIEFSVEDLKQVPIKAGSILRTGNCTVKGKACIFYATDFKDTSYFNKFLGFDDMIGESN